MKAVIHNMKVALFLSVQIFIVCCYSVSHETHQGEGNCEHNSKKLSSNCTVEFHGYKFNVYTQIFQCSQPTEMMVITRVDGLNVDHARVFVNEDERVELTGYNGAYVHVQMQPISMLDSMHIKVSYYAFDRLETVAYDRNVTLHTDLCPHDDDDKIFTPFVITIMSALAFVIVAGMISFTVLYKLHQRRAGHETKLVSQMESTAMRSPYQVGPSETSLKVEYKITVESQKTSDKDEVFMNPAVVQMTDEKQLVDIDVTRSRPKTSYITKVPMDRSSRDVTRSKSKSSKFNKDIVHPASIKQPEIQSRPNFNKGHYDSTVTMLPADQRGSKHSLTQV